MLVDELVNNNFIRITSIRIKKETALLLINDQIAMPIAKTTLIANVPRVRALLEKKAVPDVFKDTPVEGKSRSFSFKFFLLLFAYIKKTTQLRYEGFSPAGIAQTEITEDMINAIDKERLIELFKNSLEVVGKNLPSYFALEQIKVSKSTLYTLTKLHSELPPMQWNRTYTPEEIDQWRQFLLNRKYQHYFTKTAETAL